MGDSRGVETPDSVVHQEGPPAPAAVPVEAGHHDGVMAKLEDLLHLVQRRGAHEASGSVTPPQSEVAESNPGSSEEALGGFSHPSVVNEEAVEAQVEPANLAEFLQRRHEAMLGELNESEANAQIARKNSRAAMIMGQVANFAKRMRNAVVKVMALAGA